MPFLATPQRVRLRTYRRVPIQGTAFFLNEDTRSRGVVWNLSPTGCRIDAEKTVPAGTELTIILHLDKADESIHVHSAVVAWSRGQEVGLRIDAIDTPEAVRLKRYLRHAH
ncbi:MAG: PilZ domain-containing protein [Nitrospira sp.]|nr:MAG: PilZ domain-containing protein [Nitrospira sp.]